MNPIATPPPPLAAGKAHDELAPPSLRCAGASPLPPAAPARIPALSARCPAPAFLPDYLRPQTMAFKDAQIAYWKAAARRNNSRDKNTPRYKRIADVKPRSSQATRMQNPLQYVLEGMQGTIQWLGSFLEGDPIATLADQFRMPINGANFVVSKSSALTQAQDKGESGFNLAVGLRDGNHSSVTVQSGFAAFLAQHFRVGRDLFLTEAFLIFEIHESGERAVKPDLERHHDLCCLGVPPRSCRLLDEPEETAELVAAKIHKRQLVNRVFDFLMNSIAPARAAEARQKLKKFNKDVPFEDTEFKYELLMEYQAYCDPARQDRLSKRVQPVEDAAKRLARALAAGSQARRKAYHRQIAAAFKALEPGGRLFYRVGGTYFSGPDNPLGRIPGFTVEVEELKEEL